MDYVRIMTAFLGTPWAIQREKLAAMQQLLAVRMSGRQFTDEEISARIGQPKHSAAAFYLVGEDGATYREHVRTDEEGNVVERKDALQMAAGTAGAARPKLTAVLPVYGVISHRMNMFDDISGGCSTEKLTKDFRALCANPDVKAIVMDFDSPGGSVYGVEELATEIRQAVQGGKKVVGQVNPLCASAAYYLAAQCKEIAITPSGEAGSIGVYSAHQDFSKYLEQEGVKVTLISDGKYKVEGNPYEPLSEEAQAFMQKRVSEYYDMFVKAVAAGREVKASAVRSGFGQGRVLGAAECVEVGLCDRVATLDETIQRQMPKGSAMSVAATGMPSAPSMKAEMPSEPADSPEDDGTQPCSCGCDECKANKCEEATCPHAGAESEEAQSSEQTATAENTEVVTMEPNATAAAAATTAATSAAIERVKKLSLLANANNMAAKLDGWLASDITVEAAQAEVLAALKTPTPASTVSAEVIVDKDDKVASTITLARVARLLGRTKGNALEAAKLARTDLQDFKAASVLEAGSVAGGGVLIPETMSDDFIELLRPASVVRSLNPTIVPLDRGNLTISKLTGGATSKYQGESDDPKAVKPALGNVKLTAKKLVTLVPISNDLLRYTSGKADSIVRDDMISSSSQRQDLAFIRDKGTEYTPKGLRYQCKAANLIAATAGVAVAGVIADLSKMLTQLEDSNSRMLRPGWIFPARVKNFLFFLRDGVGGFLFKDEMKGGTLLGLPYRVTSQIPKNLGAGTETEIYLADFADVLVGDGPQIQIEVSNEAAYYDGTTMVSAFSQDQTVIKLIQEHDLGLRHDESLVILTGATWGA